MTVKELIIELLEYPMDKPVWIAAEGQIGQVSNVTTDTGENMVVIDSGG